MKNKLIDVTPLDQLFHMFISLLLLFYFSSCGGTDLHNTNEKFKSGKANFSEDSTAIMKAIRLEHRAYFEKDYETWQSTYVQENYLKYWGYWEGYDEKVRQYNSWEEVSDDKKKRFDGVITAYWDENAVGMNISDLNIQIRGDVAWVTFKQKSFDQSTGALLGEALETKIMERIDGNWKIAYLNFLYLPLIGN